MSKYIVDTKKTEINIVVTPLTLLCAGYYLRRNALQFAEDNGKSIREEVLRYSQLKIHRR